MEQIKVLKVASKTTKNSKPYKMLEVEVNGETRKVNIWSNFPDFANIVEGSVITGKMAMDGQYWNISYEDTSKPRGGAGTAFKTAQIEKVMDTKRQDISKFQDNKELSIKVASTMRMAVDLAIAEKGDRNVLDTLEQGIKKWRAFCWENWDVSDKDFQAF